MEGRTRWQTKYVPCTLGTAVLDTESQDLGDQCTVPALIVRVTGTCQRLITAN